MNIRLSDHARGQMAKRGIPEEVVRRIVAGPDRVLPDKRAGRRIYQGSVTIGDPPSAALVRVVVDEGDSPAAVVTVYATTQFRRYGAEP
jgi:hypothetical protein